MVAHDFKRDRHYEMSKKSFEIIMNEIIHKNF